MAMGRLALAAAIVLGALADEAKLTDWDSNLALVKGFADLLTTQGRNFTADQRQMIIDLNRSFVEESVPTLHAGHNQDLHLLDEHVEGVMRCTTDLEASSVEIGAFKQTAKAASNATDACEKEEDALETADLASKAAMSSFLVAAQPPDSTMVEPRQPTPAMNEWLLENLLFYRNFNRSYSVIKAEITSSELAHAQKAAACSVNDSFSEELYCSWSVKVNLAKQQYWECRNVTATLFQQTLESAIRNEKGRKTELEALGKIQCYLKMLLSAHGAAAANFSKCESDSVNTDAFDIFPPDLPTYAWAELDALGTPADNQCGE